MKFPQEVLTKTKSNKIEARVLLDSGRFFKYGYADPKTGRMEKKFKLVLCGEKTEEIFIVPMKERALAIPSEAKGERKVWDLKKKEIVSIP